jgi:hypothetical protein
MFIPIFGSCPSRLSPDQDEIRRQLLGELGRVGLEWRSVGRTDYAHKLPIREVYLLARHCSGGLILGFSQFTTTTGVWKNGTPDERKQRGLVAFPTPWNQLEAGILFALRCPLLVFRDQAVSGGIFDTGTSDLFIHDIPPKKMSAQEKRGLREVMAKWAAEVRNHYEGTLQR